MKCLVGLLACGLLMACNATPASPVGLEGCLLSACHAKVEHIHYGGAPLSCVDCHGGDPIALTKEAAHPTTTVSFNASTPGVSQPDGVLLANASIRALDEVDPAIIRFLNPSDYRVVAETCGSTTRGGGNCHDGIARASMLSTHATLAGQFAGGLYFAGLTDKQASFGVRAIRDAYPRSDHGFTDELMSLPGMDADLGPGTPQDSYFATMGQLCVDCHLSRDGEQVAGKYVSSGCNACHILTNDRAEPRTTDVTQLAQELGHGERHRLTNLIPDSQCNRCHHAHLHRGMLIKGVRERSEPEGDTGMPDGLGQNHGIEDPEHVGLWPAENYVRTQSGNYELYGKPIGFYVEDEDTTNDVDETPPDIHFEKGLACIDCHTLKEVHGDGHMAVRREFETQVRCESCHGSPDEEIQLGLTSPFVKALSRVGGQVDPNPKMITQGPDGELVQTGKFDGLAHPLTQIKRRADETEEKFNPRVLMGCGLHAGSPEFRAELLAKFKGTAPDQIDDVFPGLPAGATLPDDLGDRPGRLECFTCHNTWTVNCYGCHMVRDDRVMAVDKMTGETRPGQVSSFAMSVVADGLALGFGTRGRIAPMVGTSIFFTHIAQNGDVLVKAAPLRTVDGFEGDGSQHNPVHHHTIRREPRDCQGCHPRADGIPDDENILKRVIGFGTGEFIFTDGIGLRHILDRLLAIDFDNDGLWDDPESTPLSSAAFGVAPIAASTHMSIIEDEENLPGPLDLDAVNRVLGNPVVPQRPPP